MCVCVWISKILVKSWPTWESSHGAWTGGWLRALHIARGVAFPRQLRVPQPSRLWFRV